MKILIAYGTRYGTTKEIAHWMYERLPDGDHDVCRVGKVESLEPYTHVIIGSPLYEDDLLDEVKTFIRERRDEFRKRHVGVFGVALHHLGKGLYGNPEGGLAYFDRFLKSLPVKPIYSKLLGGAIHPELLNDEDRRLLERFYEKHGTEGIPFQQEAKKSEAWQFVERFFQYCKVKERLKKRI